MLKIIGACLILMATSQLGYLISRSYVNRCRQIQELRATLSLLETEIGYGTIPLVEACERIAYRHQGLIGQLFASFAHHLHELDGASTYECFQRAIHEMWPKLAMGSTERMILVDWSQTVGVSDREDQIKHLQLVKTNLKVEEEKAREEQRQYEKMFKSMGVLSGAFLIILMY